MTKNFLIAVGVVFLAVGIIGLVNDPILGIFDVNTLHNIVHLASGVLALIFAFQSDSAARGFALTFGVVYGLVAILGFVAPDFMADLLHVNMADNILHIILAVAFLAVGSMKPQVSQTM